MKLGSLKPALNLPYTKLPSMGCDYYPNSSNSMDGD